MKKSILLSFSVLSFAASSQAQQFLNGSLEPTGTIATCQFVHASAFNSAMGNNFIVAIPQADTNTYMANSSCSPGVAADGTHYVGLYWTQMAGSPRLMLKLNAQMTANQQYKFTFSFRPGTPAPTSIFIGYSNDSSAATTIAHVINIPSGASWSTVTDSITPTTASRYVFVATGTAGTSTPGMMYVDNFKMLGVPGLDVPEAVAENEVKFYPNPVTNIAIVQLGDNIAMPCSMAVYDITGRIVKEEKNITERSFSFRRDGLSSGLYFVKLTDAENHIASLKAQVQ